MMVAMAEETPALPHMAAGVVALRQTQQVITVPPVKSFPTSHLTGPPVTLVAVVRHKKRLVHPVRLSRAGLLLAAVRQAERTLIGAMEQRVRLIPAAVARALRGQIQQLELAVRVVQA